MMMTQTNSNIIKLLPKQVEFLNDEHKFVAFCGGLGASKTFAGCHYLIKRCFTDKGKGRGLIGSNSYRQLRNSTLSKLFDELNKYNLPYFYKEHKGLLYINGVEILTVSLQEYDRLRGVDLSFAWLDETRDTSIDAFKVLLGRMRDGRSPIQIRITTTPNGMNWLYDYFVGDLKTPDYSLIRATTRDNIYLPQEYIKTLESDYDKRLQQQEIDGEFVNITSGMIYYAFDRAKCCGNHQYDTNLPIYVGTDQNVNPMSACLTTVDSNDNIVVFDEISLMSSNTHELCLAIKERYPGKDITIIPDATGKAQKTSSMGKTDIQIYLDHGFKVPPVGNPHRMARYSCVNNNLEKGTAKIDVGCKVLIKDLEREVFKDDATTLRDESDKLRGHMSDAFGYLCWFIKCQNKKPVRIQWH